VLIGLWDRYRQEITAGLSRIYERYLASQAGFSSDAPTRTFQQPPKLVGTDAVGSTNQDMSVALSVDGNTAIVGGPGPNNADRITSASAQVQSVSRTASGSTRHGYSCRGVCQRAAGLYVRSTPIDPADVGA